MNEWMNVSLITTTTTTHTHTRLNERMYGQSINQMVAGTDKDLATWLSAPTTDAPRLQLLLQARCGWVWERERKKGMGGLGTHAVVGCGKGNREWGRDY